jgi:hypothetical protein
MRSDASGDPFATGFSADNRPFCLVFGGNQAFRFVHDQLRETIPGHPREPITSCHTPIFVAYRPRSLHIFQPRDKRIAAGASNLTSRERLLRRCEIHFDG